MNNPAYTQALKLLQARMNRLDQAFLGTWGPRKYCTIHPLFSMPCRKCNPPQRCQHGKFFQMCTICRAPCGHKFKKQPRYKVAHKCDECRLIVYPPPPSPELILEDFPDLDPEDFARIDDADALPTAKASNDTDMVSRCAIVFNKNGDL